MKTILALLVATFVSPVFAQYEEDYSEDLSGSATVDSTTTTTTTPSTVAPPTTSPLNSQMDSQASPATETTTTRTYREETIAEDRNRGGFYVEPAIFGSRHDADLKASNIGNDSEGTSNGFGADLKLGAHVGEMFFVAADGRYERSEFEGSALEDTDVTVWNVGPTLGLQAPYMGARVWGTYVVDGNYNPDSGARAVDYNFTDPYGWRVGAGVRLSAVSLNLEYEDLTYRTTEVESIGDLAAGSGADADFSQRGYAVSLSFPVEF